jgi:hypothetical protein
MKILTLVVCVAIILGGCGAGGSGSAGVNVQMPSGQWEFSVVPDNGTIPMFIDMNLSETNGTLTATNAQIFQPAEDGISNQSGPIYCGNFNVNGAVSDDKLNGKLSWGQPASHFANFSGVLASNGQSLSEGTYQGEVCLLATSPVAGGVQTKGTLVGYTIPAASGTFTGTLNSSLYGADVVTISVTQNPDFSLTFTGTSIENGVTTALIPSSNPQNSTVVGATVYLTGSATNVNGSAAFSIAGHPTATQLTITNMNFGGDENVTGALTKN